MIQHLVHGTPCSGGIYIYIPPIPSFRHILSPTNYISSYCIYTRTLYDFKLNGYTIQPTINTSKFR